MKARYERLAFQSSCWAIACALCVLIALAYLSVSIAAESITGVVLCAVAIPGFALALLCNARESIRCRNIARRWDRDLLLLKP